MSSTLRVLPRAAAFIASFHHGADVRVSRITVDWPRAWTRAVLILTVRPTAAQRARLLRRWHAAVLVVVRRTSAIPIKAATRPRNSGLVDTATGRADRIAAATTPTGVAKPTMPVALSIVVSAAWRLRERAV